MLYYIGHADLPGKMANAIQQMRMCEAFVKNEEEVIYLHGHVFGEREKVTWDDIADYYGLEQRFTIKTFRNFYGKTGRFTKIGTLSMALPIAIYVFLEVLVGRLDEDDIIYGRNYYPLYFLTEFLKVVPEERRPPVIYEFHNPIEKRFEDRFFSQIDGIVSITEKLAEYTVDKYNVDQEQILVAPDSVDTEPYENLSQSEAREKVGIEPDENVVMYTGHLYKGKGVETLVRAAEGLEATVYIVGGYEEDIERVKHDCGHPENVVFTGFVEPSDISVYQLAADVLVAPYTEESRPWVSPLKLFEYMAAGRPIVASDREVLQEILSDGENALLFRKGSASDLERQLSQLLNEPDKINQFAETVEEEAQSYTWENRAARLLSEIRRKKLLKSKLSDYV